MWFSDVGKIKPYIGQTEDLTIKAWSQVGLLEPTVVVL